VARRAVIASASHAHPTSTERVPAIPQAQPERVTGVPPPLPDEPPEPPDEVAPVLLAPALLAVLLAPVLLAPVLLAPVLLAPLLEDEPVPHAYWPIVSMQAGVALLQGAQAGPQNAGESHGAQSAASLQ
jgi:hypothetical protein